MNIARDWRVPGREASEPIKLGWLSEMQQQAHVYLQSQRGYRDFTRSFEVIAGREPLRRKPGLSRLVYNKVKRNIREIVAMEADLRCLDGYCTDNRDYKQNAEVLNKLYRAWWYSTFADRSVREAFQWAAIGGRGYVSPRWVRDFWTRGRGDIGLISYGPSDVLPIFMGRDHDIQQAYAVTLVDEVPLPRMMALYPEYADRITPTRGASGWLKKAAQRIERFVAPALVASTRPSVAAEEESVFPVVERRSTYILDLSVNRSGRTIPQGVPGSTWYYEVPSVGSEIPSSSLNSAGQHLFRRATVEDAVMYPLRRLIVSTPETILYDGTSDSWHGKVPIVPFQTDDWPWEYLGFSLIHDALPLQDDLERVLRAVSDTANVRPRPPLAYDTEAGVSKADAQNLDPLIPNQKIGFSGLSGDAPFRPVVPSDYYRLEEWLTLAYPKAQEERIDYLMGVRDLAALAKARQIPSADAVEKLMELAGPIVRDISRGTERSMRNLGEMLKSEFFQRYTTERKVQILGMDSITQEDYDFDPGNLVPSHMPEETVARSQGEPSRFSMLERARYFQDQFYYQVTPNSAHEAIQMTTKLLYLQLFRSGFPIGPWTVAQALNIPNFGSRPPGVRTVFDEWIAWNYEQADLRKHLQERFGAPTEPVHPPGRPPSGSSPPRVKKRPDGRTTVVESR